MFHRRLERGGTIAYVCEGDLIEINIPEYRLELLITDDELERRKSTMQIVKHSAKRDIWDVMKNS